MALERFVARRSRKPQVFTTTRSAPSCLRASLIALGAQARDDALGIDERLRATKTDKADAWWRTFTLSNDARKAASFTVLCGMYPPTLSEVMVDATEARFLAQRRPCSVESGESGIHSNSVRPVRVSEIMRLHQDDGSLWLVYLRITDTQFIELFAGGRGGEYTDRKRPLSTISVSKRRSGSVRRSAGLADIRWTVEPKMGLNGDRRADRSRRQPHRIHADHGRRAARQSSAAPRLPARVLSDQCPAPGTPNQTPRKPNCSGHWPWRRQASSRPLRRGWQAGRHRQSSGTGAVDAP